MAAAAPSAVVSRLQDTSPLAIVANCLAAEDERLCTVLRMYITRWRGIAPTVTGDDLRRRGLPPGPAYSAILGALRDAWLDGKIETIEQERLLLESLLEQFGFTR
jgi:tRNA nucleotidyltransferase (CCA-adding enzyme)